MGACIVSDEECKLVFVKRHAVDDGSKDAGILGSTRGGEAYSNVRHIKQ
jgi:hypothetical protein